jgi:hypothetical protein
MGSNGQDQLNLKLSYLLGTLNNQEIRTILFVYLHDLINRFSTEDISAPHRYKSTAT